MCLIQSRLIRHSTTSLSNHFFFPATDQPLCGNQIREENEECDCGFPDDCEKLKDFCCEPASEEDRNVGCRLKPSSQCR